VTAPREWRLGHRPALDGLRGVAVLLVVAHHTQWFPRLPGLGTVGVTAFFVLSGYLIAGTLITERNATGSLSLGRFFARRAARLLPALAFLLVTLGALAAMSFDVASSSRFAGAATYVTNWQIIMDGGSGIGPLFPIWSLAVEAQFYAAFGITAVFALRYRGMAGLAVLTTLALGAALASRVLLAMSGASFERIYYGTDTAMSSLLLGAGVAVAAASGAHLPRVPVVPALVALLGLCLLPISWWLPVPASLATAAVVAGNGHAWSLEGSLLRAIGERSYGLYLWHLPALWFKWYLPGPEWMQTVGALVITAGITAVSWRFVERPAIRAMGARLRRRSPEVGDAERPDAAARLVGHDRGR